MYEQQFNTYVNEKYDNPDGVHHYEISQSSGDTRTKIEVYNNLHFLVVIQIFIVMQLQLLTENMKKTTG